MILPESCMKINDKPELYLYSNIESLVLWARSEINSSAAVTIQSVK